MTPKEAIAYWEREGLVPAFEDGPDSPELVLQWRKEEDEHRRRVVAGKEPGRAEVSQQGA